MNPRYRVFNFVCGGLMASLCALIGFVEAGTHDRLTFVVVAAMVGVAAALSGRTVARHVYRRSESPAAAKERPTMARAAVGVALGVALGPTAIRVVPPSAGAALVPLALFAFLVGMAMPEPPEDFETAAR